MTLLNSIALQVSETDICRGEMVQFREFPSRGVEILWHCVLFGYGVFWMEC